MPKLNESQKSDLVAAAKRYAANYPGSPAQTYMAHRGLGAALNRYGYVSEPAVGHERYRNHLAIPYWRPAGGIHAVATIRFRCISDECVRKPDGSYRPVHQERHEGHGKYLGLPGHPPHLHNTSALLTGTPYLALTEGETDDEAASIADVPAVGTPGVASWRDHFAPAFAGFEVVFALGDGDPAGRAFATRMCELLPNAVAIDLGDGYDTSRYVQEFGPDAFRERLGL
ncbi:topoisomerase [Streptomyces sp. NPDC000594]|uniref:topoisomerase n=1 Tax=Streptomyces sp. NPDC000594 TaxID=3154261 RepID=UPI00332E1555